MDTKIFSEQLNQLISQLKQLQTQYKAIDHYNLLQDRIQKFNRVLTFDRVAIYLLGRTPYIFIYQLLGQNLRCFYNRQNSVNNDRLLNQQTQKNKQDIDQNQSKKKGITRKHKLFLELSFDSSTQFNDLDLKQKLKKLQEYLRNLSQFSHKIQQVLNLHKIYKDNSNLSLNFTSQLTLKDLWKQTIMDYQNSQNQFVPNQILASEDFLKLHNFFNFITKQITKITTLSQKILTKKKKFINDNENQEPFKQKKSQKKSLLTQIIKQASEKSVNDQTTEKKLPKAFEQYKMETISKKRNTKHLLLQQLSTNQLMEAKKKKQIKTSFQDCTNCTQCVIY